ncbi:hypothetical protein [Sphingomonas jaspsi]|uniref:hypothetical protein n=1 Tax=Sphingomonas jaspsi TaxID=392409 RepID=UPI0004B794F3|nr:hypothetical protein [Sphingomonas jaspsi]
MSKMPKEQLYYVAAHSGAALLATLGLAYWFGAPDFWQGFIVGMLVVIVLVLFRQKFRDDYARSLWSAGTALAFFATIAVTFWAEAFPTLSHRLEEAGFSWQPTPTWIGIIALAAFFIGFHVEMWRSRA